VHKELKVLKVGKGLKELLQQHKELKVV